MAHRRTLTLQLPPTGRSFVRPVVGSLVLHVVGVGVMVWFGLGPFARTASEDGRTRFGVGGGGGGGASVVQVDLSQFLRSDAATDLPRRNERRDPTFVKPVVVTLVPKRVENPVDYGRRIVPTDLLIAGLRGGLGAGTGRGGGSGSGAGGGGGRDEGAGRADPDLVLPPKARYSILPPLPQPSSVRGQSFRVLFRVDAAGHVVGVEVDPEIPDDSYRRRFVALMYEYSFEPAQRPDGTAVDGVTVITITL